MSHHYNASQYSEPFKPSRLCNYSPFNNTPCAPYGVHAQCLPNRCRPTEFIADENGRLFPWICRGKSSPWGDFSYTIWDQACECDCVRRLRHPENYKPPRPIFIATEEHNHEKEAKRVAELVNTQGWGTNPDPCGAQSKNKKDVFSAIQIKVINCGSDPIERKRIIAGIKKQQRDFRRSNAANVGSRKGMLAYQPGELKMVTWDCCKGAYNDNRFAGRVYGSGSSLCG